MQCIVSFYRQYSFARIVLSEERFTPHAWETGLGPGRSRAPIDRDFLHCVSEKLHTYVQSNEVIGIQTTVMLEPLLSVLSRYSGFFYITLEYTISFFEKRMLTVEEPLLLCCMLCYVRLVCESW